MFQKIFGMEKNLCLGGGGRRFSDEMFLSHSTEKFEGNHFVSRKNSGIEKF